jgi:hypothetical protein
MRKLYFTHPVAILRKKVLHKPSITALFIALYVFAPATSFGRQGPSSGINNKNT